MCEAIAICMITFAICTIICSTILLLGLFGGGKKS